MNSADLRRRSLVLFFLFGACLFSWPDRAAAASVGTTSAEILKVGVGARAIGMGEAYVALADDVNSLHWNPAGLALMPRRQASFTFYQLPQELQYNNASLAVPFDNGAIGGSLSYLSYGQIQGFNGVGDPSGDVKAYSGVGTVGMALLGNLWSAGVNLKGIQESLANEKANGAAFDVGGMLSYPQRIGEGHLRFGALVQNLGQGLQFLQQRDPLPTQWKVGVALVELDDKRFNMALDYTNPRDSGNSVQGGVEYWVQKHLALRAGYTTSHNEGLGVRAGVGFRLRDFSFDYAYAGQGELGMIHRYEVSLKFGPPRLRLQIEDQTVLHEANAAMGRKQYEQAVMLYDRLIRMEPRYHKAYKLMQRAIVRLEKDHPEAELASRTPKAEPYTFPRRAMLENVPPVMSEEEAAEMTDLLNIGSARTASSESRPAPDSESNALAPLMGADQAHPEAK